MVALSFVDYPARSLAHCMSKLRLLLDENIYSCTADEAAKKMNFTKYANGSAMAMISSMEKYGLVEISKEKLFSITQLTRDINELNFGIGYEEAIFSAAFKPKFFSQLHSHFGLAVPEFDLIEEICRNKKMSPWNARTASNSYYGTISYVIDSCQGSLSRKNIQNYSDIGRISIYYPEDADRAVLSAEIIKMATQLNETDEQDGE